MRHLLLSACLALSLAACGQGTDADAAADLASFPATVEGEIYFDLGEASDTGSIASTETTIASLAINGEDGDSDGKKNIDLQVTGAQLDGLAGDGERVRATLSGKGTADGQDVYQVSSLQKL